MTCNAVWKKLLILCIEISTKCIFHIISNQIKFYLHGILVNIQTQSLENVTSDHQESDYSLCQNKLVFYKSILIGIFFGLVDSNAQSQCIKSYIRVISQEIPSEWHKTGCNLHTTMLILDTTYYGILSCLVAFNIIL